MKGVPLRTVQELMGHKSLIMTLRYAHLSPGHTLAAIRLLDEERTGTATGTDEAATARVAVQGAEVVALPTKKNGPPGIRTPDPLIKSQLL